MNPGNLDSFTLGEDSCTPILFKCKWTISFNIISNHMQFLIIVKEKKRCIINSNKEDQRSLWIQYFLEQSTTSLFVTFVIIIKL